MKMNLPELSLILLIGPSGAGKSTFASRYFLQTEVISSDFCRGLVCDDETNQSISNDAFDILEYIAKKRLNNHKRVVVDATNLKEFARQRFIKLAAECDVPIIAIVFNFSNEVCLKHNKNRNNPVTAVAIKSHCVQLKYQIKHLKNEGYEKIYTYTDPSQIDDTNITYYPINGEHSLENGPFDIIGDLHGCYDELIELLQLLGYQISYDNEHYHIFHPESHKIVFVGDFTDRGPKNIETLKFVMDVCNSNAGYAVIGNHDWKLLKMLTARKVNDDNGFDKTATAISKEPIEFQIAVRNFINNLPSHLLFDNKKLIVAHAGILEQDQGKNSNRILGFTLFGQTTGQKDEHGLPIRLDWTREYRGKPFVVYGHIAHVAPYFSNNTCCIDTGCVFGGALTSIAYPSKKITFVKAKHEYYHPPVPLKEHHSDETSLIQIDDIIKKTFIETTVMGRIKIRENNMLSALETMSRFAINPNWLVYLPPTMSPCETSSSENFLEFPSEAFDYYASNNIKQVICEQKHMGSRAIVIVCKDQKAAKQYFNSDEGIGICYTRTGRRFFDDLNLEQAFIQRINEQLIKSKFYEDFDTPYVVLDCELMPWSAKAQELIKSHYAPTGVAGVNSMQMAVSLLKKAIALPNIELEIDSHYSVNADLNLLLNKYSLRSKALTNYTKSYRHYCWDVEGLDGIKLAPFHLLATKGNVHVNKDHIWHMANIKKYCVTDDNFIIETPYIIINTDNQASINDGIRWWESLTNNGGEGMVVKPLDFIAKNGDILLQPAIKCRGREYLRIIYGPEYTIKENLEKLRARSLNRKRKLALNEFAIGLEALQRFTAGKALDKIHECVFALLAFESEAVDPRL